MGKIYEIAGGEYFEFQQKAITELINKSKVINYTQNTTGEIEDKDKRILLYSPVGSGKTIMASTYMENLQDELEKDLAFVWLSPGEGGLHKQSEGSAEIYSDRLNVTSVQKILTQKKFKKDDVLFINWEVLRQDKNLLRREGEGTYLEECVTNSDNLDIVVIVDEAHRARNEDVIDLFNPYIVLDVTATPNLNLYHENNIVEVDMVNVINEGLLKKNIKINIGIKRNEPIDLLLKSIELREKIENEYRKKTTNKLKPLVLVQLSNDNIEDSKDDIKRVDRVKKTLINQGIPEEKIGVWLSGRRENIDEDIETSEIEYLIFKQAIATGWNCPRSHILVRLRDIKTETFNIQTMGRILRTPERKHYGNELLDSAYVLTEYTELSYSPTPEFRGKIITEKNKAHIKEEFLKEYPNFKLDMSKVSRGANYEVDTKAIKEFIEKEMDSAQIHSLKEDEKYLKNYFETTNILTKDLSEGKLESKRVGYNKGKLEIMREYSNNVKKMYNKMDIYKIVNRALIKSIKDNKGTFDIAKRYLSNTEIIEKKIKDALKKYEKYAREKINMVDKKEYIILDETFYINATKINTELYGYNKRPKLDLEYTKSKSEEPFAIWLDENDKVDYWFKNGTSASDLSIVYIDKDKAYREYYPDFIIIKDKVLYILDVKGTFEDGDSDTENLKLKYKYGKKYEKDLNLPDGINRVEVSMIKYIDNNYRDPYICKALDFTNDISKWVKF